MLTRARFLAISSVLSIARPGCGLTAQSDSLLPIEVVRVTVSERIGMPEGNPALVLAIQTVREFACLGFGIENSFVQRGDTLWLHLLGIALPRDVCPAMIGPATMVRELRLRPGRYPLFMDYRSNADTLTLTITDSSTILTGARTSFVEPDQRLRWRFPRPSFALLCENTEVASSVCEDVERWLTRQAGIRVLNLSPVGLNPYWPDTASHPGQSMVIFGYSSDAVLGRVRLCFAEIEDQIRETVGVALTIRTWTGGQINAWSRRAYHEPHIAVPRHVTAGKVCSGSV